MGIYKPVFAVSNSLNLKKRRQYIFVGSSMKEINNEIDIYNKEKLFEGNLSKAKRLNLPWYRILMKIYQADKTGFETGIDSYFNSAARGEKSTILLHFDRKVF